MEVTILVKANIELNELNDPVSGDPLEDRMRESAREAVEIGLDFVNQKVGFSHDMSSIASVKITEVKLVSRNHGLMQVKWGDSYVPERNSGKRRLNETR